MQKGVNLQPISSKTATAAIFPIIDCAFSGNFCARKRLVALLYTYLHILSQVRNLICKKELMCKLMQTTSFLWLCFKNN